MTRRLAVSMLLPMLFVVARATPAFAQPVLHVSDMTFVDS